MSSENISLFYSLLIDGANVCAVGLILIYLFGTAWALIGIAIYSALSFQIGLSQLPGDFLELCLLPALGVCFFLAQIEGKWRFWALTIGGAALILFTGLFFYPTDSRLIITCLALAIASILSAILSPRSDPLQFKAFKAFVSLLLLIVSLYLFFRLSSAASIFIIPMGIYLFPTLLASILLGLTIPITRLRLSRSPNTKDRAYYNLVLITIILIFFFGTLPSILTRPLIVSYSLLGSAGLFFIQHKLFKFSPILNNQSKLIVWTMVAAIVLDGLRVSIQ